jgi:Acyl-CoA carboxylase epsilon subunit
MPASLYEAPALRLLERKITQMPPKKHGKHSATSDDHESHIRIERGEPVEEELAALVAVLGSAAGSAPEPGPQERNLWGHPVEAQKESARGEPNDLDGYKAI